MLRPIETKEYKQKHDIRNDDFFRMIIHVLDPGILEKYFVRDGNFTFEKILSTYGNEPRFQGNTVKYKYIASPNIVRRKIQMESLCENGRRAIEHALKDEPDNSAFIKKLRDQLEFFEQLLTPEKLAEYEEHGQVGEEEFGVDWHDYMKHAMDYPQYYHLELLDARTALVITESVGLMESIPFFLQDTDYDILIAPCYPVSELEFGWNEMYTCYTAIRYIKTGSLFHKDCFEWEDKYFLDVPHKLETLPDLHEINRLKRIAMTY